MPWSRHGRLVGITISVLLFGAVLTSLLPSGHSAKLDRVSNYKTIYPAICNPPELGLTDAPLRLQDWLPRRSRSPICSARCAAIQSALCPTEILSLAWSPDGKRLAAGGTDGLVHLIPLTGGLSPVTLAGHTGVVRSIAWSPDGLTLATAGNDRTVRLWDGTTGDLVRDFGAAEREEGAWAIAWSPDGSLIATASENAPLVRLWRTRDGSLARTLRGHSLDVKSVAWSPDGTMLASASFDRTVRVWRSRNGVLLRTIRWRSNNNANVVAWSPDGLVLATGDYIGTVRLWRSSDGSLARTLAGGAYTMNSIAWSPDGAFLAGGSYSEDILVWRVSDGSAYIFHGHQGPVFSVAWSPDGLTLATGGSDGSVRLWNMPPGDGLEDLQAQASARR